MNDRLNRYALLAAAIGAASTVISLLSSRVVSSSVFQVALAALTALGFSAALASSITALRKYPSSLRILLIGPPAAGKTVYLTVLFRELETGRVGNLIFAPFGDETTSMVARNFASLASGRFPLPTPMGAFDIYEAVARFGGPFGRHYRIHVNDSAGEHLTNIEKWSPQDDGLMKLLIHSDAVIMMVDCVRVLHLDDGRIAQLETSLIATLNVMIEKRSENPTALFPVPVALVLSKSDVAWEIDDGEAIVLHRLENLVAVAQRRCRRFKYFFVSSLGSRPGDDGAPPRVLHPSKVTDPLIWILRG